MKNTPKILIFIFLPIITAILLVFSCFSYTAKAVSDEFNTNLSYGMKGAAVIALQEFLAEQGIYSGPVTGNFLALTMQGVKQFQIINDVAPSSGYFGPLTRAKANIIALLGNRPPIAATATSSANATTTSATASTETGETSTNLLAYIQFQINNMFQAVRNLQQRFFNNTGSKNNAGSTSVNTATKTETPVHTVTGTANSTTTNIAVSPQNNSTPVAQTQRTTSVQTPPPTTPTPATTPTTQTITPAVSNSAGPLSWGVYSGDSPSSLSSFMSLVGKSPNIEAVFLSMGVDSFPTNYTQTVGVTGKTLLIFWEPDNGTDDVNQSDFSYSAILSGKYDANMEQFAAAAKAYGYPVILVPMDEMNGNWEPWGGTVNGNTPAQFTQVWIHIHNLFAGVSNVKFGWDPNNESVPDTSANAISAYWPGSQYVDYVGVDGFNGNGDPWQSLSQMFPSSLMNQLASYGKPVYLFSIGSTENSSNPLAKAQWITQGLGAAGTGGAIANFPNLAGWIWFNENGGDSSSNWLVNSDAASLAAFQAAIP